MPLNIDNCPSCNASFVGDAIPDDKHKFYGDHTHFRLEQQLYDHERNPTGQYQCRACGVRMHADGTIIEQE